jgi:hypothetical protein
MSKIDWASVDWTKRSSDIARLLNVTIDAVSRRRRQLASDTLSHRFRDWQNIDWSKTNKQLAAELGKAYNTIAKKRCQLEQSGKAIKRATRSDKGQKKPQMAYGAVNQPLATAAARVSRKSGKFESNIHAKKWRIVSPSNQIFIARNLYQFVRDNSDLFLPKDVIFKRRCGKRGTGGEYCNATSGLLQAASSGRHWKGWTCMKIEDE